MRIVLVLALCAVAVGAQPDVDGAQALRDKASECWNDKQYDDGVKALKEAVALYVGVDPLPLVPWSQTVRMLVWHQVRAGATADAKATFASLVAELAKKKNLSDMGHEAQTAWNALRAAANECDGYPAGIA
ncbi:MAG: hypothetical protein ACYTGZ_19680 [Planctomycetota bacterium]